MVEKTRGVRVGELIPPQRRLGQHLAFDDADVLVYAAVPDDAEHVPHPAVADVVDESDAVAKGDEVVTDPLAQIAGAEMSQQLLVCLDGKPELPRHVGRPLPRNSQSDDFALGHDNRPFRRGEMSVSTHEAEMPAGGGRRVEAKSNPRIPQRREEMKRWMAVMAVVVVAVVVGIVVALAQGGAAAPATGTLGAAAAPAQAVALPAPVTKGTMSVEEALATRRSIRAFQGRPLTQQQISQLLWAAQGITDPATGHRTAPSAMAKYPLTVFLFDTTGVYRYVPKGHLLARVLEGDHRADVTQPVRGSGQAAPVSFVLTGDPSVFSGGHSASLAAPFVYVEVGHAAQNLALEATALGLGTVPQGGINAAAVSKLLNLPEGTIVVYTMPVGYPAAK